MAELLTLSEVAELTRVPIATLRYWRSRGEGPETFRLGRRVVAFKDALDAWIRERAQVEADQRLYHRNTKL
jgi:DNA-binding transcriptional MerR regulator